MIKVCSISYTALIPRFVLAGVIFLVFLPVSVSAATVNYYVDPAGTNEAGFGTGTGTDAFQTIQYAISNVANPATDTIIINISGDTYTTNNTRIEINRSFTNLTLKGASAESTIIQSHATKASATTPVFHVYNGNAVTFDSVTVRHGYTASGSLWGAGIFAPSGTGALIIRNSIISHNTASGLSYAGGLYTGRDTTIENSLFHDNTGTYVSAIYFNGSAKNHIITNSTFYSNSSASAGGIYNWLGNLTMTNSIMASSGQMYTQGSPTVRYKNSILVRGVSGAMFYYYNFSGTVIDGGNNIVGSESGSGSSGYPFFANGVNNTTVVANGTTLGNLNISTTLATNGSIIGGVSTLALLEDSPAINGGATGTNGDVAVPTTDARGLNRDGTPDIGPYEYDATSDSEPPTVSLTAPANGATVSGSSVTLSADADDETAMSGVTFYVNSVAVGSEDTSAPYSITWDSTTVASGEVDLVAIARDSAGNTATSSVRTIIVDNDPAPSTPSVTASSTGATLSWTTTAAGSTRVFYGLLNSLATSTLEINTAGDKTTNHSVSLEDLPSCAFYKYRTVNNSGSDIATSTERTFQTECTGGSSISASASESIVVSTGGTLTHSRVTLGVPSNVTATTTDLVFQVSTLNSDDVIGVAGKPNNKTNLGGIFHIKALYDEVFSLNNFNEVIEITLSYDGLNVDESTLFIGRYDGVEWQNLGGVIDTVAKTITATTTSFSDWGIFGDELPAAASGSSTTSSLYTSTSFVTQVRNMFDLGNIYGAVSLITSDLNITNRYLGEILNLLREYVSKQMVIQISKASTFSLVQDVRNLELGMEGDDVAVLQKFLIQQGYQIPAGATGYFGLQTQYALDAYQTANSISPRGGYFGPITRAFMKTKQVSGLWW